MLVNRLGRHHYSCSKFLHVMNMNEVARATWRLVDLKELDKLSAQISSIFLCPINLVCTNLTARVRRTSPDVPVRPSKVDGMIVNLRLTIKTYDAQMAANSSSKCDGRSTSVLLLWWLIAVGVYPQRSIRNQLPLCGS